MNTVDILAIGQLAERLLCPLSFIRRAAQELDIKPAMRINQVDYFAVSDLERIEVRVRALQSASRRLSHGGLGETMA